MYSSIYSIFFCPRPFSMFRNVPSVTMIDTFLTLLPDNTRGRGLVRVKPVVMPSFRIKTWQEFGQEQQHDMMVTVMKDKHTVQSDRGIRWTLNVRCMLGFRGDETALISPVLLLNVSKYLNMFCSNVFAISQQFPSTRVHQAFISHVRKHKALCSYKIQPWTYTACHH